VIEEKALLLSLLIITRRLDDVRFPLSLVGGCATRSTFRLYLTVYSSLLLTISMSSSLDEKRIVMYTRSKLLIKRSLR
jgi:hypothetical protein